MIAGSSRHIAAGSLSARVVAAEDFELDGVRPFDLAVAVRVGAPDGRHPSAGDVVRRRVGAALTPVGRLLIDGGNPLREIELSR